MKRTTIFVPEPLERDLHLYARHEGKAVALVVREALAEYLGARWPVPSTPSFVGVGRSGRADTAERHEELLWTSPHGGDRTAAPARPVRKSAKRARRRS